MFTLLRQEVGGGGGAEVQLHSYLALKLNARE
jgi:hypothetical protein